MNAKRLDEADAMQPTERWYPQSMLRMHAQGVNTTDSPFKDASVCYDGPGQYSTDIMHVDGFRTLL